MGIPNACLWLKADDGAGTPGSSVGTWQDRSRNGKNLTGDSAPPTLVAGSATEGMNFNPVVRFDGNGQTMTRNESTIGTDASEINVFFVSRENKRQDSSVFSHSNLDNLRLHAHWPWITGDLYWDKGACCTTAANRNHSTAPFAMGVASLGLVTNSVVARTAEIIANAKKLDDVEPESPGLPITGNFLDTTRVGSMRTKSDNAEQPPYWYNGDIAELLEFKRNLDATQRTRVQSYLALKYGLTLDRDGLDRGELKDKAYTDGNDRAVYSYSGYWNSIIGIGRDRVTGLNQSVSRSTQKIGTGTDFKLVKGDSPLTIATAKSDGTADFSLTNHHRDRSPPSDGQYLVLGDNDGALTFDPATKRLHRVWRAQNTGGVGPVYLGFDADKLDAIFPTGKPGSLLVSTDANFGVGNTTLYPLGRVLISGKYVFTPVTDASSTTPMSTTRVTIPNGAYITLGQHCTGTALGIADACLWLKADDGADTAGTASATVSTWRDRSGNDKDMTGVGNPSVVAGSDTEGMNFNPVVRFNGSNQSVFRNESTIGTNASEINVFFVSRENARQYSNLFSHSTRDRVHLLTHWPWSDGNLYWDTGDIYDSTGNCCVADHRHYTAAPFKKKVANLGLVTNSVRANTMEIVVNAKKLPDRLPSSPVESPGVSLVDDSLNITSLSQGPNWYNGDIPEFLEFRRDLDATQRTRVQSYLALKYGLTLDRNGLKNKAYTSGNDASVYSYSDYWNSIIGIGRDSVTGLDQRVSRSTQKIGTADPFQLVEGDSPLTIATPKNDNSPDFTSANGGSRPELQPGQYLVLGDNNGDVATLGAATAEQFGRRIGRVWRAQNTGGVGAVYLGFDPTLLETNFPQDKRGFLLVSTDADFSVANTTRYALGRVTVGSKTVFTPVTDIGSATPVPVTIPNGSYITLGQESVCTGTVMGIADACLWLKANDDGLTPGGTVSTWPDRSGSQKNLTGENSPSVVAGSNTAGMNFNPVVRFNGSNQSVVRNESTIGTDVSEINIFFVNRETARKNSILLSHSNDGAPQRLLLHWPWGNGILAWDRGPCCVDPRPSSRAMSTAPFPEGVSNLGLVTNSVDTSIVENVVNARTLPKLEESKPGVRITGTFLDTTRIANGDYPLKTGGGGQFAANPYKGDFPELLEFKRHLNPTERTRVQSYLALKYGLTLDRDGLAGNAYTSGSGTSVYSDSNYWNSIIGIGRDSVTKLDQRVSRSTQKIGPERGADGLPTFQLVKGDSPLTIATSADFTSANGNHRPAENLPLEQYLVLGDNNGALNTLSASAMGSSLNRVPRVWRARNTGVSAVFLGLEKEKVSLTNTGRRYLFVESGANADGSFPPSRTRTYVLSNTLTDLTGYWVPVANGAAVAVNIPDGAYLSYGVRLGPAVTLTVQSRGGTGTFGFSGNRGFVASSATTTTEMQPRSTPEQWLPDDNGDLVISVAMPSAAGWRLEAASCIDRQAAASGNPGGAVLGGVSAGNQFTIPAAQAKASADLHCALVARYDSGSTLKTVSGRVFVDNGVGSGVANDGKINGAETGRSGAALSLTNCGSGGTTIYAYTSSSGDGSYSLKVPPTAPTNGTMCVTQTLIDDYRVTQGGLEASGLDATRVNVTLDTDSAQSNRWRFTYAGANVQNLHIGNVPSSRLLVDGTRVGIAGSTVDFPHRLIAGTAGTLTFGVSDASPAASGWSEVLYRDFNCNAQLDAGEPLLGGSPTVAANEHVCVIVRQFVPAGLYEGATRQFQLQATLNWANAAPRRETLTNRDHTQVSGQALRLYKEVRNVTTDALISPGHESWTTSNSAKPGETLEYRTTFTNLAPEPITKLEIYDATPNYTTLVSAECPAPLSLPAGLTCEPLSSTASPPTKPIDGGTGPLRWRFNGPLPGGAAGAVKYRVKVNE